MNQHIGTHDELIHKSDVNKKRRSLLTGMLLFPLLSTETSAKVNSLIKLPFIESDFISKTEEYQEQKLPSLGTQQKEELLKMISKILPEVYQLYVNTPLEPHLLRIGYTHIYLNSQSKTPRSYPMDIITGKDIFYQTESILRKPILGMNRVYKVVFPNNIKKPLEPFDIISPENEAIIINGSYGVYDNERCREYTYDGKATQRFLKLHHGDIVEMLPFENNAQGIGENTLLPHKFKFPSSIIKDEMPQCSQVARELGQKIGRKFLKGDSALATLRMYKNVPTYKDFSKIPEVYVVADVFMNSKKHKTFGHRAFAFKNNNNWYIIDPYSHKDIISAQAYRRKNDIIEIIAFM